VEHRGRQRPDLRIGGRRALDTRRNRVLVLGGYGSDQAVFTLGSPNAERITLSGVAAGSVGGKGNGMVYDPWMDAFLLRKEGAGPTVYRINAQTLAVDTLSTSGGSSIPESINGVYRRFLFARSSAASCTPELPRQPLVPSHDLISTGCWPCPHRAATSSQSVSVPFRSALLLLDVYAAQIAVHALPFHKNSLP